MSGRNCIRNMQKKRDRKNKKLLIFVFICLIGLTITLLYIFYGTNLSIPFLQEKECEEIIQYYDKTLSEIGSGIIKTSWEPKFSDICEYSVKERDYHSNNTIIEIRSCDATKIKNALNNPAALSTDEIEMYIYASDQLATKEAVSLVRNVSLEDFSVGCNHAKATSSLASWTMIGGNMAIVFLQQKSMIDSCTQQENFTEKEKKECLIEVLNAEKSMVESFSTSNYDVKVESCVNNGKLKSVDVEPRREVCKKIIEYRKKIVERVKESDIDYNQKYYILATLKIMDKYIGGKYDSTQLKQNIVNKISNQKYKSIFLELRV